jgi:translation initiation factor IF-3
MEPYIVTYANFSETRLIDSNEQYYSLISMKKAKDMARMANLDLVCFNAPEGGTMALCKIIDYGKWKYSQEKKKKKEHQAKLELKELRFTPVISDNDLCHKVKQIIGFLQDGHEVMVVMRFKGIHHRLVSDGEMVINKIVDMSKDVGKIVTRKKTNDNITIRLAKV